MGEALCLRAQGHAEARRQCTCRRARARAFPFFIAMGPASLIYLATFSIGSQPALMDAGPPSSRHGSSYTCTTLSALTPSRFRERANKFFGLVAERRRVLRQMVVAPGELLRRLACGVFAVYS